MELSDILTSLFERDSVRRKINARGKRPESSRNPQVCPEERKLNPNAKEWSPSLDGAPEEERSLFITFSYGYPLSYQQIANFFTRIYGACVEKVLVNRPKGRSPYPLFGKIIFTSSTVPAVILRGHSEAKVFVEGRQMWCKKYQPPAN